MKKLLSLTLVVIILLSMLILTSCDPIESVNDFFTNIFSEKEPPVENEQQEDPPIQNETRTTITSFEWTKSLYATNYTLTVNVGTGYSDTIIADNTKLKLEQQVYNDVQCVIYDYENAVSYAESSQGFIGYGTNSFPFADISLGGLGFYPYIKFSDLVYEEDTKSYTYTTSNMIYEFRFEDGNIVYSEALPIEGTGSIIVDKFGTSTVEIGDWEIITDGIIAPSKAPSDTITTVTNEQILENLAIDNCTMYYGMSIEGLTAELTIKITKEGAELNANLMGETEIMYLVNIDGSYYPLDTTDSEEGYVVYLNDSSAGIGDSLNNSFDLSELDISTFTYNEQGRYYTMKAGSKTLYFFFENGRITKVAYTVPTGNSIAPYTEVSLIFSDFGTTTLTVPEYKIIEKQLQYVLNDEGTGYIVTGIGSYMAYDDSEIIIPEYYNGLPVVEIQEKAFFNNTFITKVVVPDSIQKIGEQAFAKCSSLKTVVIGDSVSVIEGYTFYFCPSLEDVTIGNSVTTIGPYSFAGCTRLFSIVIPNNVIEIKTYAFHSCTSLNEITLGNSIKEIGAFAFNDCSYLTTIIIPKSVATMGNRVFDNCIYLTIKCEVESKPEGWENYWNIEDRPVQWGYISN